MSILRLKELLKEKGITGKELAVMVGVTEASISNIVKGDSIPRKGVLLGIADSLDVDVRDLFNATKDAKKETQLYKKDETGTFVKYAKIIMD